MQPTLQGSGFGNFQAGKAGWIAFPGLVSVLGQLTMSHCHLCPRVPNSKRCQDNHPSTLPTGYHPSGLFSLSKCEVRAGWPLAVPRQLQDKLGGGHEDHQQR
jgi:hypothetical protein